MLQSSRAFRKRWQSYWQLHIAYCWMARTPYSFIFALRRETQSRVPEPCRYDTTNSLDSQNSSSSLVSITVRPNSEPTVQETTKSRMQIPASTRAKLIQFSTALFALPQFWMTLTRIQIWCFLQSSQTITPSKLLRTFSVNSLNYLSCLLFLLYRELKGATVYSMRSRKSVLLGR